MSKLCSKCKVTERDGKSSWCRQCRTKNNRESWQEWPIEKRRAKWLRHKYKLSYEQYELMYYEQDGKCKICSTEISLVDVKNTSACACVDHCHKTNKVRGLLCNHCNRALGLLKENETVLQNMLKYVQYHNS